MAESMSGLTLTSLVLDCEGGGDVVPAVIATHPGGDAALNNVQQTILLCQDQACSTTVATWTDDFAGSGVAEFFGSASPAPNAALIDTLCGSASWPVRVTIADISGSSINETVCAQVTDSR